MGLVERIHGIVLTAIERPVPNGARLA